MRDIATLLLVVALAALVGCSGVECPAMAYGSVASIEMSDARPGLSLELCGGEGCIPGDTADSAPMVAGDSDLGWTAAWTLNSPRQVGYRLTDGPTTVAEGYVDVTWTRIDGSEQCGGNQEAIVLLPT
jgi:hypothetical protein